jgi:3-deoxy-manno-octulosonate cytidylyltransferase (CMP-KDO synthetase)
MIVRTYLKCVKVIPKSNILVATDSQKIIKLCNAYKIHAIMTSKKCLTGSDRVAEISKKIDADIYINLQGDEPIFPENDIMKFIRSAIKNKKQIINGYCKISNNDLFFNYNIPKIVLNEFKELIYISRAPIPSNKNNKFINALKQVCIYSYPKKIIRKLYGKNKKKTFLERIEDIEILRPIEKGYKIKMIKLSNKSISVDTKLDVKKVTKIIK